MQTCDPTTCTCEAIATVTATPTITPTVTPTVTPPSTPIPNGGSCVTGPACASGFCVDLVCCDTACNGPLESCKIPPHVGSCTSIPNAAPATSTTGLVVGVLLLTSVAAFALRYQMRGR